MSETLILMAEDKRYGDEWRRVDSWLVYAKNGRPSQWKTPDFTIYMVGIYEDEQEAYKAWADNQPDVYNKEF
jgi:hypothetical protein